MEALQIKIDNQDILRDGVSGIYYTQKNWRQLVTSDNASDRQGGHGRNTSPTYARTRVITLEGYIDRLTNNNDEKTIVEYMESLFALQPDPSILDPKIIYVKDVYDREWTLAVKIKEPFEIHEGDMNFKGSHWSWRVVLESVGDPTYIGSREIAIAGVEGAYGGFDIDGIIFPFSMDGYVNEVTVTNTGNAATYPRIEIIVGSGKTIDSPLRIRNISTGEMFMVDVEGSSGDSIIIDSESQKISKNGIDITASRIPGSVWPKIIGKNRFIVDDADGGIFESDLYVKFYYKNSLL